MTKKQKQMLSAYLNSDCRDLDDAYGRCSYAKERAYAWCESKRERLNGYSPRIPSHNTFQFTYAFIFEKVNDETGVVEAWMDYETASNSYQFMLTDNSLRISTLWDLL